MNDLKDSIQPPWHLIRAFSDAAYPAVMRVRDAVSGRYAFQRTTTDQLTRRMRQQQAWHVAGWKLHIAVYPGEYALALPALRALDVRLEPTGLVLKYAVSKRLYENLAGAVKGKFATIYCMGPADVPPTVRQLNAVFAGHGITPLNRRTIATMEGLRHELPLVGGYGFVRYGAFSLQRELLDLSDPQRHPLTDDRLRPYPRFSSADFLEDQLALFKDLIVTRAGETPR